MARPRGATTAKAARPKKDTGKTDGGAAAIRQPHHGDRLSSVAENYLLALYMLREESVRATLGHLADYLRRMPAGEGLGTTLPTVNGMVRRMEREGLLAMTANKDISLTERGNLSAEDMVRRHRLAERLVVDLLDVDLADAHVEAHRLEHAITPALQAKIIQKLGNPQTCPFGRPIPGSGYQPTGPAAIRLDAAAHGALYRIDRVPEEDQELLRFLVESGMLPGAPVRVLDAARYRGVLTVEVSGKTVALGYDVAAHVWVKADAASGG